MAVAAILAPATLLPIATVFDAGWAQNGAQSTAWHQSFASFNGSVICPVSCYRRSGLFKFPIRRQIRSYILFRVKGKPASLNFFIQSLFFNALRTKEQEEHNGDTSRTDSY